MKPLASVAVPPGVVNVMLLTPGVPAGAIHVRAMSFSTTNPVAVAVPNRTELVPVRLVPVMVTTVPPAAGPATGDAPEIVGAGWK